MLLLATLVIASWSTQDRQQVGGPMGPYAEVRHQQGPLRFCAGRVAIDIEADERVGWQEGPDFDLYYVQSERGGFAIYQGQHPQLAEAVGSTNVSGLPAQRLREANGDYAYLVQASDGPIPTYVQLYGAVWKGDERDELLLARVRIGAPRQLGCERPTFNR